MKMCTSPVRGAIDNGRAMRTRGPATPLIADGRCGSALRANVGRRRSFVVIHDVKQRDLRVHDPLEAQSREDLFPANWPPKRSRAGRSLLKVRRVRRSFLRSWRTHSLLTGKRTGNWRANNAITSVPFASIADVSSNGSPRLRGACDFRRRRYFNLERSCLHSGD